MQERRRTRWRLRFLAILVGLALAILLGEIAARILVKSFWPADQVLARTVARSVAGRYASADGFPYVLAPNHTGEGINSAGFRSPKIARARQPGVFRIACIGASTTYGFPHPARDSYPAALERALGESGLPTEVMNAGVPGWVSTEVLRFLELAVLDFHPDIVVHYEGRNEVFPEGYHGFKDDYSHYRRPDYRLETANLGFKKLFRWSHLAMLLCTWRGDRFGWSTEAESPDYGSIRRANRPDAAGFVSNLSDPRCTETWRRNLKSMAARSKASGATMIFVTMACRAEKFGSGNLDSNDPDFREPFGRQVLVNNVITKEVATVTGARLVDAASLADDPTLFPVDDCHLSVDGYRRLAALVRESVVPVLSARR